MQSQNAGGRDQTDSEKSSNRLAIALSVVAMMLVVTWAVATVFEIELAKALAMVILVLFGAAIALFSQGLA